MDAQEFQQLTGYAPEQDDLERANCQRAGLEGHYHCGLCGFCGFPRFIPNMKQREITCDHRTAPTQQGAKR